MRLRVKKVTAVPSESLPCGLESWEFGVNITAFHFSRVHLSASTPAFAPPTPLAAWPSQCTSPCTSGYCGDVMIIPVLSQAELFALMNLLRMLNTAGVLLFCWPHGDEVRDATRPAITKGAAPKRGQPGTQHL